jgi:hypothetical protein
VLLSTAGRREIGSAGAELTLLGHEGVIVG